MLLALILFLLFLFFLIYIVSPPPPPEETINEDDNNVIPAMHSICTYSDFSNDFVCDLKTHTWKKSIDDPCSCDLDCSNGLVCINWSCQSQLNSDDNIFIPEIVTKDNKKKVKWVDDIYNTV